MDDGETMQGRCLCGAVTLRAAAVNKVDACHCGMCRRWGGGPYLSVHVSGRLEIEGEPLVTRHASSEWAERGFCSRCGTHLFYRLLPTGEYAIPAGLLDDQDNLVLESQIFIDRKPPWYDFAGDIPAMTEAEVLEKYAAK